jgi:cysteine desulfuration protein SufE
MTDALQDMIDDFAFLDDWEERYMHVIDLGKGLEPLSDAERIPATKVQGCASQVWIVSEARDGRLVFRGDSDAHIVRGLIAVVITALSGREPEQILATDIEAILGEIGLAEHLSSQRANGLRSMVARIRAEAETIVSG